MSKRNRPNQAPRESGLHIDVTTCTHSKHQQFRRRAINELRPVHGLIAAIVTLECGCAMEAVAPS